MASFSVPARLSATVLAVRAAWPRVPGVRADAVPAEAVRVDVRSVEEWSVSRLPGAVHVGSIDLDALEGRVVVACCTVGVRSAAWAARARDRGLDARNLEGGVLAWAWAGGRFVCDEGTTDRVHTWSRRFAWLPDGVIGVVEPRPGR